MSQSQLTTLFQNSIQNNSLSHAYLIYGQNPHELSLAIQTIIQDFLTLHHNIPQTPTLPKHPDILILSPESNIKINDIKDVQDKIKYGAYEFKKCFVIIPDIHTFTTQAANAFLKTLEEPLNNIVFFLQTTHFQNVLPTIKSRCNCIYLPTTPKHTLLEHQPTFQQFLKTPLSQRLNLCGTLASDKESCKHMLETWLHELQNTPTNTPQKHSFVILSILKKLQANINLRLQLETLCLSIQNHNEI